MEAMQTDDLIQQARELCAAMDISLEGHLKHGETDLLLAACETFYLNGTPDDEAGSMQDFGFHAYRVNRWIVVTDEQGFRGLTEFPSTEDAMAALSSMEDRS